MTRRGQRAEVGHGGAGDEGTAGIGRQTQQLEQPAQCRAFDDGGGRRGRVQRGVLVPRRGQPVAGHRDRQCAADYEAEVASARAGHGGGRGDVVELAQRLGRRLGGVRQRNVELGEPCQRLARGWDAAPVQALQILYGALRRFPKQLSHRVSCSLIASIWTKDPMIARCKIPRRGDYAASALGLMREAMPAQPKASKRSLQTSRAAAVASLRNLRGSNSLPSWLLARRIAPRLARR